MKELSFYEKLVVLFDNIMDHPLFILIFLLPIIMFFLHKKHGKKVFIIVYFLIIFTLLILFGDIIFALFDNLMDGLFMFLYFPNFITLFGVVVACSIIAFVSLSKHVKKINKVINFVSFGLVHTLFSLILITVRAKKINIYKDNALYTNNDVLSLMQLLIGVFAIQVFTLIIIKLIDKATIALDKKANFSSDVNRQIKKLSNTRIKSFDIDNNKVGFINVADRSTTSKPKLKPFKFDIQKLESVNFNGDFVSKGYSYYDLDDKDVSYYNEIIPRKLFNKIKLDFNKHIYLSVYSPYRVLRLDDKDVSYVNENLGEGNLKRVKLDYGKFAYLKTNDEIFKERALTPKKYRPIVIDSNKIISLNVPNKSFKIMSLDDKKITYLNEQANKKFKKFVLDLNKTSNVILNTDEVSEIKPVSYEDLNEKFGFSDDLFKEKNKPFSYEEVKQVHDTSEKPSEYDKMFNSKPEGPKTLSPMMTIPSSKPVKLVDNMRIVDIQSTLDVVVKCHLMKGVILKTSDRITVSNLDICNYKLLSEIIKVYRLVK